MLYSTLGKLESAPVLDTLTREVLGINAPKIALTRSDEERRDTFYSEVGNTVGFFGAGLGLNALLNKILPTKTLKDSSFLAYRWGVLGRSAALFSTGFAIIWAMPFIRNYITATQTGSVKFTQVIGAHKPDDKDSSQGLAQALHQFKKTSLTILGLGIAGSALAIGGSRVAIAKQLGEKTLAKHFDNPKSWIHHLTLKDGQFANFSRIPSLLFWGLPAYGGWIHASRDPYERKEQVLKFANFVACFYGPDVVLKQFFQNKLKAATGESNLSYKSIQEALSGDMRNKALKIWATKSATGLLSSIFLLSTMPQLINIYLTKQRLAKAQQQKEQLSHQALPPQTQQLQPQLAFANAAVISAKVAPPSTPVTVSFPINTPTVPPQSPGQPLPV